MSDQQQFCVRCGRPAPEQVSDAFLEWEALDSDGEQVICPACITEQEHQAMYEDTVLTLMEADLSGEYQQEDRQE